MSRFVASQWLMDKTGVSCAGGMVVAKQDLAAWAGAQVLADGGNAIDAAVTVGWVMAVMEPYNTSIAGAGYMVYRQADGTSHAVDYSNRAPSRATPQALESRTSVAFSGPLSAATPGTVAGLCHALERFGTIPLARAMEPAIRIAEEGMPLNWLLTLRIVQELPGIRSNPFTATVFLKDGDPGMAYDEPVIRQPDLARTLRAIADGGPDAFYRGPIARELIGHVNDRGGILDEQDFASYQPSIVPALKGRYRDYDVLTVPVPASGITTLASLEILAGFDLAQMGHNSAEALHTMAEAFRLSFADRDAYLGDPDYVEPAEHLLLSDEYIEQRRSEINPSRAMSTARPGKIGRTATGAAAGGGGTTHFCVMDSAGNLVSSTQTLIGGFSSIGVAGSTGVIVSGALQWFDPRPGSPNGAEPGKRPLTNMCPIIVERDGQPVLAVGAPGSRRITNAVSQTTLNVLAYGMDVQRAISAPRIDCSMDHILADDRIATPTLDALRARGHRVEPAHEFINEGGPATGYRGNFARPAAIFVDEHGIRHGGDYPFVEGMAIGVQPD